MDEIVADLRPFLADREVTDVVAHARSARREDREIGAALALEFELRALDAGADLVVRHLEAGPRWQRGLVLDRLGLVLAETVQVLGFSRVVAVTIDDHDTLRRGWWARALLTAREWNARERRLRPLSRRDATNRPSPLSNLDPCLY